MNEFLTEDDITIKNRILLREIRIRALAKTYLDLIYKFNTFTRNEIAQKVLECINEIDFIEISLYKGANLEILKDIDINYQRSIGENIEKKVTEISNEIVDYKVRLDDARKEKEFKIHCEEAARIVNSYEPKENLEE
jgi:hypothetical protein